MPAVSVIFITWNHEKYIEQAIASLAAQTFRDFDVIFLDNCSSDQTREVALNAFARHGLRITDVSNDAPQGVSANLNKLIAAAGGALIAPISGDDWWHEQNLEKKVAYFDAHPDTGLLYSGGYTYYEDTGKYELMDLSSARSGRVFDELIKENFIVGIGNTVPRRVYEDVGVYNTSVKIEDWDMWLRIAYKYEVGLIKDPLVYYRRHSSSYSVYHPEYIDEKLKVVAPYAGHPNYRIARRRIERFKLTEEPGSWKNVRGAMAYFRFDRDSVRVLYQSLKKLKNKK